MYSKSYTSSSLFFDNATNGFTSDNAQSAIEEAKAGGILTFPFELHYVSGVGLNTVMSNSSFFRVPPGTNPSGSYSGYPSAFPIQIPYDCKLQKIILTFRAAAFDYNAVAGPILFDLELRSHVYNGSSVHSLHTVSFGSFSGSSTGHDQHTYELYAGTPGFTLTSGTQKIDYGAMIGARFVKTGSGDRRINNFTDIVMKLLFEEY